MYQINPHNHKSIRLARYRIIQVVRSGQEVFYVTKGDNNEVADTLMVKRSQIVGIVKYKVRYVGYPTVLLNGYR